METIENGKIENKKIVAEYSICRVKRAFVMDKRKIENYIDDKNKIYYYFRCELYRDFGK